MVVQKSAMVVAGAAFLLATACDQPAHEAPRVNAVENESQVEIPALPVAEPAMDRAALLKSVAEAASAAALEQDDRAAQRELDGARFELRIRFACPGTAGPAVGGPFGLRFEPDSRTLRLRAAPELSLADPFIASLATETVEAVEGFWMHRPWLLSPGCPSIAPRPNEPAANEPAPDEPVADEAAPPAAGSRAAPARREQRVGIAQFFTAAEPRARRRDQRAYEVTMLLDEGERPSVRGYDLVLSGRLRRFSDGRVIVCRVLSADAPPNCVISAQFDRVRFEQPDSGKVLAEWASG